MKPKIKFNNGNGTTLCKNCNTIINTGISDQLLCSKCQEKSLSLLKEAVSFMNKVPNNTFDRDHYNLCGRIDNFIKQD